MLPQSPFVDVLHTNYVPSSTEINDIHSILTERHAELDRLDAEIARLRAAADTLSKERDKVAAFIDSHQALVSPARRLPFDVLGEIFWHCLPSCHDAVVSVKEAPLLLGRICSAWRTTALCAPRLWSALHVVDLLLGPPTASSFGWDFDPLVTERRVEQRCEGIAIWLSRSGQLPLSISVSFMADIYTWHGMEVSLSCLVPFSRRWQTISMDVAETSLGFLNTLDRNDFPLLESLTLRYSGQYANTRSSDEPLSSILQAPRLTEVTMVNFDSIHNLLLSPPAQLTHLVMLHHEPYCHELPDILGMLQQCPNLESCTLKVALHDAVRIPKKTHIPALRTFRVSIRPCSSASVFGFFETLVVPELRDLTVEIEFRTDPELGCPFMSVISKTDCLVERLAISGICMSHAAVVECLSRMRRLTTLWVEDMSWATAIIDEAVVQSLIMSVPGDCLCPSLDTVIIRDCRFSEERLIDLLESRCRPGSDGIAVLRVVKIHYNGEQTLDISSRLETFHRQGMRVSVTYQPSADSDYPRERLLKMEGVYERVGDYFR